MASKAFRRIATTAALARGSVVRADSRRSEESTSCEPPVPADAKPEEAEPARSPGGSVVIIQPNGKAGEKDSAESRVILEEQDDKAVQKQSSTLAEQADTSSRSMLAERRERQRLVLNLGASLAREPAVQEAVLRRLQNNSNVDSTWCLASSSAPTERSGSDPDAESLGLGSLPSSLGEEDEPGAFFSEDWCFRSEEYYLDSLVMDDSRARPSGQAAGETARAPVVLEESELAELVHRLERELEHTSADLEETSAENERLRRQLRTHGILETDEQEESRGHRRAKQSKQGAQARDGDDADGGVPEDAGGYDYLNAALGFAALIIVLLACGKRGAIKDFTKIAAAWIWGAA